MPLSLKFDYPHRVADNFVLQHESLQFFRNSFSVIPIAKTIRDIEEQYGCTPEMCMPIFPNVTHPTGRPALHTEPTFPYSGCYIWTFAETQVRVAEREEGWKTREAVRLPPIHEVKMQRTWGLDYEKIEAVIKQSRVTTKKPIGMFLSFGSSMLFKLPAIFCS